MIAWLVGLGATPAQAERIAADLAGAGIDAARGRAWVDGYTVRRDGPFTARAASLLRDGDGDAVVTAAAAYAAASPDERAVSFLLDGGNVEADVRRLTGGDPDRTRRVRRVLELLLAQLQTTTRVYECLVTTFGGAEEDTLGECLLDDRFDAIRDALEVGAFDAWRHLETGVIRIT